MQTVAVDLVSSAWVEILDGNSDLRLQVATANNVRLHFNQSATAPDLNAPSLLVQSFPPQWDFECNAQGGTNHVWARADVSPAKIVIVRRTI